MSEILALYVSSFWAWLGITIGLGIVVKGLWVFALLLKGERS